MAVSEITLFRYKNTQSFLHKTPPLLKIAALFAFTASMQLLNIYACTGTLILLFIISLLLHFSPKETFSAVRPLSAYAALLYITDIISEKSLIPTQNTVLLLARLFASLMAASLVFRTTTSCELKAALSGFEMSIKKRLGLKGGPVISRQFALLILFIPMMLEVYNQTEKAWMARGGKNGIKKLTAIIPIMFSVGMKKARDVEKAISARTGSGTGL